MASADNFAHFLSGALGGVLSTAATYPMLNIATRLQVQRYDNTVDALVKILKEEGVSALFAGFSSGIFGVAASQGIFFYTYELVKEHWTSAGQRKNLATWENLLIGALAGVITAVATNPIWVVNTRMSVARTQGKNAINVLIDIINEEGILSLFNGLIPALILVSNPSIQYMVFEQLRTRVELVRARSNSKLSDFDFFWLGLVSKFVASTITYPYILVKSKLQAKQKNQSTESGVPVGTREMLQTILRTEGFIGLFQGYGPRISQSVLTAAILFLAKEKFFNWTIALLILFKLRAASPTKS